MDRELPKRYRHKAEECRMIAERSGDYNVKQSYLKIAATYDQLAEQEVKEYPSDIRGKRIVPRNI